MGSVIIMGEIGRMIEEGEQPHTADLYGMWFGAIGSGYIMPVSNRCEPTLSDDQVTIDEGKVSFGVSENMEFSGITLTPDAGSEFPRYDLIYLEESDGEVAAVVSKGSGLKLPSIGTPPDKRIVPIAVLYWNEDEEIEQLKDVRVVVDPEHAHGPGDGLELDNEDVRMDVSADEETITTESYQVEVKEANIPASLLHEGLILEDGNVMNVDTGLGLEIDDEDLVVIDLPEITGDGLTASDGQIDAAASDGMDIVSDRVTVDEGEGVILRGTTPDRQIDIYHQEFGGVFFEDDRLIIQANDFEGAGLYAIDEKLNVREGLGISVGSKVDLDVSGGLSAGTQLDVDLQSGGGIMLDEDEKLYAELQDEAIGLGLQVMDGYIEVDEGDGISTSSQATELDLSSNSGLTFDGDGALTVETGSGTTLGSDYGRLMVDAEELAGAGLRADDGDLAVDVDEGLQITSDRVEVEEGSGVTTDYGELKVVPEEMVDGETLVVDDFNIFLEEQPNFFELLADETFSLEPGDEHVITVPDVFPMVSINAVGQQETNHGEYEWFYQEHHEEYGDKQEIVISYPDEDFYDEINLRARIYHVKWIEWME